MYAADVGMGGGGRHARKGVLTRPPMAKTPCGVRNLFPGTSGTDEPRASANGAVTRIPGGPAGFTDLARTTATFQRRRMCSGSFLSPDPNVKG